MYIYMYHVYIKHILHVCTYTGFGLGCRVWGLGYIPYNDRDRERERERERERVVY